MAKRPSLTESMKSLGAAPTVRIIEEKPPEPEKKAYHASTREGMSRMTVVLPPEDHKRVKLLAVNTGRTIEDLMREATADLLKKLGG